MNAREGCKGCSEKVRVSEKQLERILSALAQHPEDCVDDEQYHKRLAVCRSCPSLAYETTCLHCGCFVAVRAKLKEKDCPFPGQSKWM
ncbi:DUF6171 family protein [Marinicrinis lubricantis]|uniref:DUF6171 family protein n=1 Tax=Marinicrinis lubricantis TaxID=2086470 RepID=A0ABW1IVL8_9BACL